LRSDAADMRLPIICDSIVPALQQQQEFNGFVMLAEQPPRSLKARQEMEK
jgi:hypothetical protein